MKDRQSDSENVVLKNTVVKDEKVDGVFKVLSFASGSDLLQCLELGVASGVVAQVVASRRPQMSAPRQPCLVL